MLFVLVLLGLVAFSCADEQYSTKYDNIDLDEILNNRRLLTGYVNCLLDKGACSPEGVELKSKFKFLDLFDKH